MQPSPVAASTVSAALPTRSTGPTGPAGPTGPTAPEARLLVVDDEPAILELLSVSLRFAGFEVETAADGVEALNCLTRSIPDLLVLDVMMPKMGGFDVARQLRGAGNHVPVVFLTAKDATEDRITGLTLGGDDYITKPFSLEEVVARIRAVLRRTSGRPGPQSVAAQLTFADLVLDDDSHEVYRGDREIELSPTEFNLLRYLMQNPGRVLSKTQILEHVWNYDFGGNGNVVESYVSYLRRKIDVEEPRLLHTVRGVGYALRTPKTTGR